MAADGQRNTCTNILSIIKRCKIKCCFEGHLFVAITVVAVVVDVIIIAVIVIILDLAERDRKGEMF